MMTEIQRQAVIDAAAEIIKAEAAVTEVSKVTSNADELKSLKDAHHKLDGFLTELVHAQAIADDEDFTGATTELKRLAEVLRSDEEGIKKIVGRISTAAQIVGYAVEAACLIVKVF